MAGYEHVPSEPADVILRAKDHTFQIDPDAPLIMGIINIGNDSVADGTSLTTLEQQLDFALDQVRAGAHIIDIGVQSGRTDTPEISPQRELDALEPLVCELAARGVAVSVDTYRAPVARAAIAAGASIINDTSGLADQEIARVAAQTGAALVLMHTRAQPKQQHFPTYEDVVGDVSQFLEGRIRLATEIGVAADQLLLDPGPDFAKTPLQSIEVLRELERLEVFKRPILLAVSRKYFIGVLTGKEPEQRLAGTLAAIATGLERGANVLRVHDVDAVVEFLEVHRALHTTGEPLFKGRADDERLKWIAPKDHS
jgi:dihydropteroate synthase